MLYPCLAKPFIYTSGIFVWNYLELFWLKHKISKRRNRLKNFFSKLFLTQKNLKIYETSLFWTISLFIYLQYILKIITPYQQSFKIVRDLCVLQICTMYTILYTIWSINLTICDNYYKCEQQRGLTILVMSHVYTVYHSRKTGRKTLSLLFIARELFCLVLLYTFLKRQKNLMNISPLSWVQHIHI